MRLLVVENSKRMQNALELALADFGQVAIADSAQTARLAFEESSEPFDIVITDFHMRGGSGLEVVDYVNANHPGTPVVVLTAYATKELTIDFLNRQVFQFIEKPIRYETLKEVVTKAMNSRQRSLSEKRVRDLGVLSNLIFHEIGGNLQDLLYETQSLDFSVLGNQMNASHDLVHRFTQLRDNIRLTTNAFHNLKQLILTDRVDKDALQNINLCSVLNAQREWLEHWTKSDDIRIDFKIDRENVIVKGPTGLVNRAVRNILLNAVEAVCTKEGDRRISIELSSGSSEEIDLKISNNGPPISAEDQKRIFDFGYSTRHQSQIPRGIGLYVVDRIMANCGGRISLSSNEQLTTFQLIFVASEVQSDPVC